MLDRSHDHVANHMASSLVTDTQNIDKIQRSLKLHLNYYYYYYYYF